MNRQQRRTEKKQGKIPPQLQSIFASALGHHREGRLAEAERLYRQLLDHDPRHADSLHMLGVLAHQVGRHDLAEDLIAQAAAVNARIPGLQYNLALALQAQGKFDRAAAAYRQALRQQPESVEAHSNLGNTLKQQGRFDEAAASYRRALAYRPDFVEAHSNLGNALKQLGRPDQAMDCYRRALAFKPDFAEAHGNLGVALKDRGALPAAVTAGRRAAILRPQDADALCNLGSALAGQGKFAEAVACCRRALVNRPDSAEAQGNLGVALKDQDALSAAAVSGARVVALQADDADAALNLGSTLLSQGNPGAALACLRRALVNRPDFAGARSNILIALHYLAESSPRGLLAEARRFGRCLGSAAARGFANQRNGERRIRIGYVSGDFRAHPVGFFMGRVLAGHDPRAVEVFCYSNSPAADAVTGQLRSAAHHWRSLVGLPDQAAAALIGDDAIDILVDLSGHTALNRLPLFALRPAPIQVGWLGYFGTTGLTGMDYILADRFVAPPETEGDFTEALWRLPESYLCFTPPDPPCPILCDPAAAGDGITFGSFNNHAKTSPRTIALWSAILRNRPGSRLLLKTRALADRHERGRLLDRFAGHGIAAERLLLEGASPRGELLAAYNRLDVALDPVPYGGGTTTAEALWMGVPVVTLRGTTWVGRVAESILSTVGLPHLVAAGPDGYVALALDLAAAGRRPETARAALRAQVEASALCDGARFTRALEEAYRGMWRRWCA